MPSLALTHLLRPSSSSSSFSSSSSHLLNPLVSRLHYLHHTHEPHQNPNPNPNPYDLMNEDPIEILSNLWLRSFSTKTPFPNLTGFLKKFPLWVLAYQRSVAHHTGTFPPKSAIHLPHLRSLLSLQHSLFSSSAQAYHFNSKTNLLLRSPSDPPLTKPISRRKFLENLQLSPPPFQDRVVQELLLSILEPVFEPRFSSKSHAYRPGRSPHTVIRTVRSNFAGYLWFLKADLTPLSDNLDPDLILHCLRKGVTDRKVLQLVRSALRTPVTVEMKEDLEGVDGMMKKRMKRKMLRMKRKKKVLKENEPKPDPYWLRTFFAFAPVEAARLPSYGHCGILSPLLVNVCLDELDRWMESRIEEYFRPSKMDSIWRESIDDGCHNPAWPEFVPASGRVKTRKMDYVRYGSHILIGIRGPREDVVELKKELVDFLEGRYGSKLENSRIEIEHITRGIEFLDHTICRRVIHPTLRYTATGGKVVSEKGVGTLLSVTANMHKCITQFRKLELVKGDTDPEPLPCTPMLYAGQAHTNSQMNKFLETMADWYRYADNRKKIVGFCAYVVRSSLAKLYAARYRLKSRAKVYKIASRDLSRPLRENTNNDAPEYSDLLRMGLVDAIDGVQFSHMSLIPSCDYTPFPRNWVPDHERILRDYIRLQDPKFFCELYKLVKRKDLILPQDDLSKIIWNFKVCGVHGRKAHENVRHLENSDEDVDSSGISAVG